MRKVFAVLISAGILLFACTPFQSTFERIEPNKLRPLNAVFLPLAEGAPGDTITIRMYFAGDTVSNITDWQLSIDDILNDYGTDTVINYHDLIPVTTADKLPDSISLSFVIPDSAFYTTLSITDAELNMVKRYLPSGMRSLSRSSLIELTTDASKTDFGNMTQLNAFFGKWGTALGITSISDSTVTSLSIGIAALFNVFSIKGFITCTAHAIDGKILPIRCQFVIRYNSALTNSPLSSFVPVNHNPEMHWIAVVSVKKDSLFSIDLSDSQWTGRFAVQYLYNDAHPGLVDSTVLIDTGHSYFFAADSGITPLKISDSGRFIAPTVIADSAALQISLPQGKINVPVLPGDTLSDPFKATRLTNATFYRPQHIVAFSLQPGDTLLSGNGKDLLIDSGSVAAPIRTPRSGVTLNLVTRDFGVTSEQTIDMETYSYQWWFQNLDAAKSHLAEDSLLLIPFAGDELVVFYPPVDSVMHRFKLWVAASDNFLGEFNRPIGKTTRSANGYFKFSQAYISKHQK